jgi:4-alpha-glucanotransferase
MPTISAEIPRLGVLLHVTSLPSPYGIGDVGPAAIGWIDWLHEAGQGWWQSLPLGPTGYGNSPYQSMSSFAGNGLLISPDWLIEDGLLRTTDCAAPTSSETAVAQKVVQRCRLRDVLQRPHHPRVRGRDLAVQSCGAIVTDGSIESKPQSAP